MFGSKSSKQCLSSVNYYSKVFDLSSSNRGARYACIIKDFGVQVAT